MLNKSDFKIKQAINRMRSKSHLSQEQEQFIKDEIDFVLIEQDKRVFINKYWEKIVTFLEDNHLDKKINTYQKCRDGLNELFKDDDNLFGVRYDKDSYNNIELSLNFKTEVSKKYKMGYEERSLRVKDYFSNITTFDRSVIERLRKHIFYTNYTKESLEPKYIEMLTKLDAANNILKDLDLKFTTKDYYLNLWSNGIELKRRDY